LGKVMRSGIESGTLGTGGKGRSLLAGRREMMLGATEDSRWGGRRAQVRNAGRKGRRYVGIGSGWAELRESVRSEPRGRLGGGGGRGKRGEGVWEKRGGGWKREGG